MEPNRSGAGAAAGAGAGPGSGLGAGAGSGVGDGSRTAFREGQREPVVVDREEPTGPVTFRTASNTTQGPQEGPRLQDADVLAVVTPPRINRLPEGLLADLDRDLWEPFALHPAPIRRYGPVRVDSARINHSVKLTKIPGPKGPLQKAAGVEISTSRSTSRCSRPPWWREASCRPRTQTCTRRWPRLRQPSLRTCRSRERGGRPPGANIIPHGSPQIDVFFPAVLMNT